MNHRSSLSRLFLRVSSRPASAPRRLALAMAACSLFTLEPSLAQAPALPTGLTVAAGQAQVSTQGSRMTVTNSPNAILNWNSFSIGAQNTVRFDQVNAASKVLNRVTGSDPSQILGQLSSNGQVWLLNPNGVLFGAGARVDVASLVTSTLALQDRDWLAGRFNFTAASASSAADVVNQGEIRSALGGRVLMLGGNVRNEGVIDAAGGQVLLAAGQSIELVDTGAPNLTVKLTAPSGEALNLGTLSAAGGRIDVHAALVNQQGLMRADSLSAGPGGEIVLQASERLNLGAGSVTSASAASGDGGRVKLLGREVGLFDSARVAASGGGAGNGGEVLVGGGQQGKDASVPNAQAVYFGRDALISADAGTLGNGGRIILWSDAATRAFGSLSAQGGAQGGDGGFIETSGGWLDARPLSLNVAAPKGRAGQWLLDPYDIIIADGQSESGFGPGNFTANADNARIDSATLTNALNQGINVTVSTSATGIEGTQDGGITVSGANILVTAAAPGSLTLIADADIGIFDSVISSSTGAMPVSLLSSRGSFGGVRILESTIATGGGRLLIGGFGTGIAPDGTVFTNATRGQSAISNYAVELGQNTLLDAGLGAIEINAVNDRNSALVIDTGAQLRAADILLRGTATFNTGVSIDDATLTATHSLTVQGRGGYQGVSTGDGALLEVAPAVRDTTAALTVTGLGEGADSGVYLSSFSSVPAPQLVVSNGATLTVSGANEAGEGPAVSVTGAYYSVGPLLYSGSNGGLVTVNVFGNGDSISFSDAGVGTLGAGISMVASGQIYLGNAPITAAGKIDLRATEISLDSGTAINSSAASGGDAIVLRGVNGALSRFYNSAGAGALTASGAGQRWIVYATDFLNTNNFQAGGLAYGFKRYGAASPAAWANDVGNGFVASTPQTATFTATAASKVYDGTTTAAVSNGSARGASVSTDIGSLSSNALPAFDSKNVGTAKPITFQSAEPFNFVDFSGKPVYGYTLVGSLAANITPAQLSGLVTAANKVYDATRTATVNVNNLSGLVAGETVVVSATGQFADKNVGNGKTVTATYQLNNGANGELASNYRFITPSASPTANITPLALTATGLSAGNKVYDATTLATLSGTAAVTALASDQLNLVGTATGRFADKNVGTAKAVAVQGLSLTGSDAGNYTLNPLILRADITPATLTLVGVSANSRVYDTTTVASLNGTAALSAAIGSDQVALAGNGTAAFLDKNVGTAKPVQLSGFGLTGADAGNYLLNTAIGLSANITPAPVTLAGLTALDRVYDATTRATLGGTAAVTPLSGDQLRVAGTAAASFDNKNVGNDKPVTVQGLTLAGADAGNYTLTVPTLLADITPAALTITGLAAANKVYDAGTAATLTGTAAVGPVLGSDQVTLGGSALASFSDKNVGTAKPVAVSGYSLAGADAANYQLTVPTGLSANITPATLTYTADTVVRTAGGTFGTLTGSVGGFVGAETLSTATAGTASFATTADASSPAGLYAVNGSGLTAQNYVFVQALGNARALELTGLPPELPQNGGSDVAVNTALVNLSTIRLSSEPASGGLADVTPTTRIASSSGRADFGSVSLASMSPQALQNMLDARDRYKKTLFAESIVKLEQNPGLADLQPCTSMQEAAVGTCLVTEQLKAKLQDGSGTVLTQAPTPPAPAGTPANTPATPQPAPAAPAVAAAPAAAVPAVAPSSWSAAKRKVRSASLPAIERKVALVIGVDNYADPRIPKLGNAVRDAEAIGQVFETGLGYETVVLANARKADVVAALNGLALELNARDSVMIYYAGHGELIEATQLGYWQLADSDAKKPESWLSNADISRLVSRIGASQVALISDSCYSGSLVNEARIRATPGKVDPAELLQHKSVVVMSSGGNEPVFDNGKQGHSPFAWNLMNTLQKVSSWQAGGQVFERVRFAVARELPQRPQYGASSMAGHQPGGDYLFEQRQLEARN